MKSALEVARYHLSKAKTDLMRQYWQKVVDGLEAENKRREAS